MSTSENRKTIKSYYFHKRILPYAILTVFCGIVPLIYAQFSHGVSSPHMTFLFVYPLVAGLFVGLFNMLFARLEPQSFLATHCYHTGLIALILSSLLRGIFEIAGTSSIYITILTLIGLALMTLSLIFFCTNHFLKPAKI